MSRPNGALKNRAGVGEGVFEPLSERHSAAATPAYVGSPTQPSNYLTLKGSFSAVSKPKSTTEKTSDHRRRKRNTANGKVTLEPKWLRNGETLLQNEPLVSRIGFDTMNNFVSTNKSSTWIIVNRDSASNICPVHPIILFAS